MLVSAVNYALNSVKIGRLCHCPRRQHPTDRTTSVNGRPMCPMCSPAVLLRSQNTSLESHCFPFGDFQHSGRCRGRIGLCGEGELWLQSIRSSLTDLLTQAAEDRGISGFTTFLGVASVVMINSGFPPQIWLGWKHKEVFGISFIFLYVRQPCSFASYIELYRVQSGRRTGRDRFCSFTGFRNRSH